MVLSCKPSSFAICERVSGLKNWYWPVATKLP